MKKSTFTFLLLAIIALVSCRKDKYDPTITQFDEDQIKAYIAKNNITGMVRDSTGIYYKTIKAGSGAALLNTDSISMVYTLQSFDGNYISNDTLINHYEDFTSHLNLDGYPIGVQFAVLNIIKQRGSITRLLVPSHLAYGVSGNGSGSKTLTNVRISGNQCLDYNLNIIDDQAAYDQNVIKSYIAARTFGNPMQKDPAGFWYAIDVAGTGTVPITDNTTATITYTTQTLDSLVVDDYNTEGGRALDVPDLIPGVQMGLKKYATAGAKLTFLFPSSLAYGKKGSSGIVSNSCVRFDVQVLAVSP